MKYLQQLAPIAVRMNDLHKRYRRIGECNRRYDCARLNCCGDCEYLNDENGVGVCTVYHSDWDCGGRLEAPTLQHWLQQTYWSRGEPKCSFSFIEVEG